MKSNTILADLHKIIQTTMGWTNSHLHQFIHADTFYSEPDDWGDLSTVDYRKIKLGQLLKEKKDEMVYEYDFGDSWAHKIALEKVIEKEENRVYPECIGGKNACPPEDCGGIWGYMELLDIISNPSHEEHEEMLEWLEEDFDPKKFEIEEVNEALNSKNYGVFEWDDGI